MTHNFKNISFFKKVFVSFFITLIFFSTTINLIFAVESNISIYSDLETSKLLELHSNNALLMDADSGAILYSKNGFEKVYPASTTKIMTAILAIENLDLNTELTATKNALYSVPSDSSSMYLKIGETLTVKEILYGMLLNSGNDAANVLAEKVSGSIKDFVVLMNKKKTELGCINTNFKNTHGYHDDEHYTTPYDMAVIMTYALKNETFKEIVSTSSHVIGETNKTKEKRYLYNTNKMLFDNRKSASNVYYEYAKGGKTGFTAEALGTYVGYASKNGKNIISACFKSPQNIEKKEGRFLDSIALYNYAFDNFEKNMILNKDEFKIEIKDEENNKKITIGVKDSTYSLTNKSKFYYTYVPNIDTEKIVYDKKNNFDTNLTVGSVDISFTSTDWAAVKTYDLVLKKVEPITTIWDVLKSIFKVILYIVLILIILFVLVFTMLFMKNKRKGKITRKKTSFNKNDSYSDEEDIDSNKNIEYEKDEEEFLDRIHKKTDAEENSFLLGNRNRKRPIATKRKKINYISFNKKDD